VARLYARNNPSLEKRLDLPSREPRKPGSLSDGDVLLIGQSTLLEVRWAEYMAGAVELQVESETLLMGPALTGMEQGGIVGALRAGSHRLRR
jgi:hypothetical protein